MAEQQTHTFISGRSQRTALLLLTAAAQLEQPKYVVEAQRLGYKVPVDVAERYEVLDKELAESDGESTEPETPAPEPDLDDEEQRLAAEAEAAPRPVKKAAPRKRTAKKTAAKKTAAKTTQSKE